MRKICTLFLICSISLLGWSQTKEIKKELVYHCNFDSDTLLKEWVMEGPGIAKIENNQLLIYPKYQKAAQEFLERNKETFGGAGVTFYPAVEKAMRQDLGEKAVKDYYGDSGKFMGGHIVFWNRFKTPENYIIEFDFKSLSPHSLHMIMFSATGEKGENVFSKTLKPRNGVAAQYTKGDLKNYRISFYAPTRKTSNMRKCPGRHLICKGPDYTVDDLFKKYHFTLIKDGARISWYIDGKKCFDHLDQDAPLGGGQTAIRLMVPAKAYYDNYRIYKIVK